MSHHLLYDYCIVCINIGFFCRSRLLREIRDRYLHSGSPLELPAETRNRLRVNKASGRLTISQLKELQTFMVQGLREYWWVNDKSFNNTHASTRIYFRGHRIERLPLGIDLHPPSQN